MWRGGLGAAYLFPALSPAGASLAGPCSVSTSRSSNRTGGVTASGSRKRLTLFCVTPPATSEHKPEAPRRIVNPQSFVASCVRL